MPRANPPPSASPIRGVSGAEPAQPRIREWTTADEARRVPIGTKGPEDGSVDIVSGYAQQLARQDQDADDSNSKRNGARANGEWFRIDTPGGRLTQDRHTARSTRSKASFALGVGANFCLP